MHLFTLIVGTVLLPQAYSLKCYECARGETGTCSGTEVECVGLNSQCASSRVVTYQGESKFSDTTEKGCASPQQCHTGSINFGAAKSGFNVSCCATDLCNDQPVQELRNTEPNGKQCYTCKGLMPLSRCRATMECVGDEDHCVTATATLFQITASKGCATTNICSSENVKSGLAMLGKGISCCQGDLCNGAGRASAGVLLLLPLLYFTVFS